MPCAGPSEYEIQEMEAQANKKKFGKYWTNEELYKKRRWEPDGAPCPPAARRAIINAQRGM